MAFLQRHFSALSVMAFVLFAGLLYGILIPKQFEVSARVVVNRSQIETPNFSAEESKNRWVWVRDGYAIKDALLSGEYLSGLIDELPLLKERYLSFQESNGGRLDAVAGATHADLRAEFVRQLEAQLKVDFLGGDSFTYVLSARDPNPLLAKRLLNKLIDRIRFLVIDETRLAYQNSLESLRAEISKAHAPSTRRYLEQTYQSLLATSLLFEAQAPKRVDVVKRPAIPLDPAWPRLDRLFLMALVLGLGLGLLLEYVLTVTRQPRVQTT